MSAFARRLSNDQEPNLATRSNNNIWVYESWDRDNVACAAIESSDANMWLRLHKAMRRDSKRLAGAPLDLTWLGGLSKLPALLDVRLVGFKS